MEQHHKEIFDKAIEYLKSDKVTESNFDMCYYRLGSETTHECNSSGCVLGHVVVLLGLEDVPRDYTDVGINFEKVAEVMFEIDGYSKDWSYLFHGGWQSGNQLERAIERMETYKANNYNVPSGFDVSQVY